MGSFQNTDARETEVDYSIVIPVYYNEGSIRTTAESIKTEVIAKNPSRSCEIIFVDDGSGDASLEECLEVRHENSAILRMRLFMDCR